MCAVDEQACGRKGGGALHEPGLESPGLLDPVALITGGLAGELRALWARLFGAAAESAGTALVASLSGHAVDQAVERGVTMGQIEAAARLGERFIDPKNQTFNYILRNGFASGQDLLVGVRIGQPNFITTVLRGRNLVRPRMIPYP